VRARERERQFRQCSQPGNYYFSPGVSLSLLLLSGARRRNPLELIILINTQHTLAREQTAWVCFEAHALTPSPLARQLCRPTSLTQPATRCLYARLVQLLNDNYRCKEVNDSILFSDALRMQFTRAQMSLYGCFECSASAVFCIRCVLMSAPFN
jgi:hypothetical protein